MNNKKFSVSEGNQIRDFCYVDDVVKAIFLTLKSRNSDGEIINIGTGINYSVLDLVKMVGGSHKHIPPRKGEAKETLADISKAKKLLNWEPKVKLEEWIKNN